MRTSITTLAVTSLTAILNAAPAQAALTQVNVRIEGRSKTLFEGPILTEGHDVSSYEADGNGAEDLAEHSCDGVNRNDPENTSPGATSTAAASDAMNLIGEADAMAGQWYGSFDDYYVKQWGDEEENAETGSRYWGVLVNDVFIDVGGCQYELAGGDEVLWIYNAFDSRPILGLFAAGEHYGSGVRPLTAQAQIGKPFEVEVDAYDDHGEGEPPATPERTSKDTSPYEGAEVAPVETSTQGFETVRIGSSEAVITNSEGKASITFTTPGWHRIMAGAPLDGKGEEAAIRSNRLDVCVPAEGQSGCGEPPAEDAVRTPARYSQEVKEVKEEEHQQPVLRGNSGDQGDEQQESGSPAKASTTTSGAAASDGLTPGLAIQGITSRRLVLKFTAPGRAIVKIARRAGRGSHRHWQTIETIAVKASKAGALEVKLPRLVAGSYQVSISLAGTKPVLETLTVPRRRR
jgi:hypothetical protein